MLKKETFVIGSGVVADYFKNISGYRVEPLSWIYSTDYSYNIISDYETVVYADETRTGALRDILNNNYQKPYYLSLFLMHQRKGNKFVYISTAELYNGNYEWEKTKEDLQELNVSSDYLLSKRIAERTLEENDALILRIKNPFSEFYHPDNWLVRALNSETPSNWMDCHTYLPDLQRTLEALTFLKKTGIYNTVQTETGSDLYYLQLLNVEKFKDFDLTKDIDDFSGEIGADVNSTKAKNHVQFHPMHYAVIRSYEMLKNSLDIHGNDDKLQCAST